MSRSKRFFSFLLVTFLLMASVDAQTKRLKRPKNKIGVTSVDQFVSESFDLYDKVYMYDGYAKAGTPLEDKDVDVLENALEDLEGLSSSAVDIASEIDGVGLLKQGKATLQLNRAKKALTYSIKTAKDLLLGSGKQSTDTSSSEEESQNPNTQDDSNNQNNVEQTATENISDNLEIYSKFDYVPGDELIFFEDFSQDFVGDFPARWNTNGSGEIVKINKAEGNWLQLKSGYNIMFIPDIKNLPEDYTIEFDVITQGMGRGTSSTARLSVILSDDDKFKNGSDHYVEVTIPFGQYAAFDFRAKNFFNRGVGDINSSIKSDIRDEVLNQPHFSISVTKNRYRLWLNEVKYIDIPRFVQELNVLNHLKFHINNFKDGEELLFISNLKVAKGGVDLRRKLLSEGKISTNGILFDSGSANIKPQSYGIIRQISQVMIQDENINLQIIGHTDADGTDDANLKLSKDRASAIKQALIDIYKISGKRLNTDGKGESEPVGDNNTPDGKAQNRRVEFIKN